MSKAILIIDEMPKNCEECVLKAVDIDGDNYCAGLKNYSYIDKDDYEQKRKYWRCPLKKVVGVFE